MGRALGGRRHFVALVVALACCPCAFALDPALDVSQYAHTSWKIREGFVKGNIVSIAQTPDGYLWLGTVFGLVRFDGVRAVPWQPPSGQALPSTTITRMVAARDGTLWIGTLKGLASWKGGTLRQYEELAGEQVHSLLEDREGVIWAGTINRPVSKLCAIRGERARCYEEETSGGRGVFGLYEDRRATLWVSLGNALWRWKPEPRRASALTDEPDGIRGLSEDDDGTLLVGMRGGVQRLVDGKFEAYRPTMALQPFRIQRMLRDRDGGLWIATGGKGLVHVHQERTDVFARSDGLSGDYVIGLFEDREGTVWVATLNGLDRFRELAVPTFSAGQGLLAEMAASVLAARDGSVWIATNGGLNRWRDGQVTVPATGGGRRDGRLDGLLPHSLFQDQRGRLWVTTYQGIGYLEGERYVSVKGLPLGNVHAIAEDAEGSVWFSNVNAGLFRVSRGHEVEQIPPARLGREDAVSALAADPLRGGLWLGFMDGGLLYFAGDQARASYGAKDGLGQGKVNRLRFDPEGTLWAGTDGGLSRLKNGRITTLASRNGLPCDAVHWGIEDDARTLWLRMACGLVSVTRSELAAWTAAADKGEGAKHRIQATVFDEFDGVPSRPVAFGYVPQVTKSADGKVWFANNDGVSVFDPRHVSVNKVPPPVRVEGVIADRIAYLVSPGALRLPPRVRDLQIDYTALSMAAPEKVRFRYKLEGWDRDWQDAGTRRQAFYGNLPPRDYRFRVTASNNSGVWNETGDSLDLSIAPAYYQAAWFRIASLAFFLTILAALYRLRLQQVAQRVRLRTEARLEERERIARDLHDTLLQSVQGLILKIHAVTKQIHQDHSARAALEETLDHADQVLAEGRDRVRDLRAVPTSLSDLPAAFQRVAEETPQGRQATLKTVVEGPARDLHPLILEEAYSIGREAVINALAHSEGLHVEVEITYDPRQFRLRIRDDGRGVDPAILEEGGRAGHWGLQGMRERAQRIGAQLQFWSRPGTGTEVELTVPAATAYRSLPGRSKSSWFRRYSGIEW